MDLIHLIPQLRLGAGRYVVDLALAQARADPSSTIQVLISTDAEPPFVSDRRLVEELTNAGVPVLVIGDFFRREVANLRDTSQLVKTHLQSANGWAAHAHTAMAAAVARMAGADALIGTCHGVAAGRPPAFDLQDALAWRMCDAVTSPSRHWAARLTETFAVETPHVIPYGLNLGKYPVTSRARTRSTGPRLVTVAELTTRKGIDVLLDAMARLWTTHPHAECHIMGDGDSAAALHTHARRVDERGERVIFHGFVPWPYLRLTEFDLFVLPSRSDNQPIAAIEAMLAGLPVVASDVGGLGELVRDAHCGWTVRPDDSPALAQSLGAALDAGADERALLGRQGEAYARRTFDIENAVTALRELIEGPRQMVE